MAAAPVESCQSLPNRSPWGRLGSVLYTRKRLHRMRRRFKHFWSISLSRPQTYSMNYLAMASMVSVDVRAWREACRDQLNYTNLERQEARAYYTWALGNMF